MPSHSSWCARLLLGALCLTPLLSHAKLTTAQKLDDFRQLIALYERSYAPAAWKKQYSGFDLSDAQPWLGRVTRSTDDIEFIELCVEYVASLSGTHSAYELMCNDWRASLPFEVGSYVDGGAEKILVDRIDRAALPAAQYPFQVGDELVSLDGVSAEAWVKR